MERDDGAANLNGASWIKRPISSLKASKEGSGSYAGKYMPSR
jgi:hypothetical protein